MLRKKIKKFSVKFKLIFELKVRIYETDLKLTQNVYKRYKNAYKTSDRVNI